MNDTNRQEQQDASLYDRIAARTAELLDEGKRTFDEALKKAKEEAAVAESFTREQAERIAAFVRRDLAQLSQVAEQARKTVQEAAEPQRVLAGAQSVFARILTRASGTLAEWAARTEQALEYATGETTSPGTLTCKACGASISLKKTGRIPPCPKCHQTAFRKSY